MLYVKYGENRLHGFRVMSFENVDDGQQMSAYTISSPMSELKIAQIILKFEQCGSTIEKWVKDADGMANSVDPEQSDPGQHCLPKPIYPKT